MLDQLVKRVIERKEEGHIDWVISQVINDMSNDEVLEFALEHDRWCGGGTQTQDLARKVISGEAKVMKMADIKSGFFNEIKSAVKAEMKK